MNIEELTEKCKLLEQENAALKEHLKKYTSPARCKNYYENHKEEILKKNKLNKVNPEKKKEYNRVAYLKKKEKMQKEKELTSENNI